MASKSGRFLELEGLRGLAAISVVGYHFALAFYTLAFWGPGGKDVLNMKYEAVVYANPAMVFLSGTFSVAIFFVLSGFVLSIGFFQTGKLEIIKKLAAKRYLRLMLPALASILIAYFFIKSGITQSQEVATLSRSPWLAGIWTVIPHFFGAIYSGVVGAFVLPDNPYNAVLWTMPIEFLGSFMVFGFLALFANSKYRPLLYAGLLVLTFNTWFMGFIAGMILADLYGSGRLRQIKRNLLYVIPIILAGLFLGGYPSGGGGVYQGFAFAIPGITPNWLIIYLTFGAIIIVGVVLATTQVANIFRLKWIAALGKYTFSLYLTHTLVLFSLTMALFFAFYQHLHLGYNHSFIYAVLLSAPVVVVVTYLFERYVDAKSIVFSSWVASIFLGERKLSPEFLDAYNKAHHKSFNKFSRRRKEVPGSEETLAESAF